MSRMASSSGFSHFALGMLGLAFALMIPGSVLAGVSGWPAWNSFGQHFIQSDGRVVEHEANGRTTSEGQAYAMFFALVNNDFMLFRQLLDWTENNLARGDLSKNLLGWHWGRDASAQWRLLDDNSASDASLWMAYTLLEAGRLWQVPRYRALGLALLAQAREKEVLQLPNGAMTLLPGPQGFRLDERTWRVNPSYFVPQHFSAFARADPGGPWRVLETQLSAMLAGCCPAGFAPDWLIYRTPQVWQADPARHSEGSYDAIRVYLWVGMMNKAQPGRDHLLRQLAGMQALLRTRPDPPERVHVRTGRNSGSGPPGFVAALLPYLQALGDDKLVARALQQLRVSDSGRLQEARQHYYDQVLALFGLGYMEQRYRFSRCGALLTAWNGFADDGC